MLSTVDRDSFALFTMVGRLLVVVPEREGTDYGPFSGLPPAIDQFDYPRDGVLRLIEERLGRPGLDVSMLFRCTTLPIPSDVFTEMKAEGLISAQASVPGGIEQVRVAHLAVSPPSR